LVFGSSFVPKNQKPSPTPSPPTTYEKATGRKRTETDQDGHATAYDYYPDGGLEDVYLPAVPDSTNPGPPRYHYTYDAHGDLATQTDPLGHATSYTHDAFGHKTSETLPDGTSRQSWSYNGQGQLDTATDFDGHLTRYTYDDQGRVLTRALFDSAGPTGAAKTVTFTYDNYDTSGRRYDTVTVANANPSAFDDNGTTTSSHDAEGRLVEVASPRGKIGYEYDPRTGQKARAFTSSADPTHPITDLRYTYDGAGRLASVEAVKLDGATPATPQLTTYAYDLADELVATTRPNGTTEYRTYDALGRLAGVEAVNSSGRVLAGFSYTLDLQGRRVAVAEDAGRSLTASFDASGRAVLSPSGTPGRVVRYAYDADGRLTSEAIFTKDLAHADRTLAYTYDLAGNRSTSADSAATVANEPTLLRYTHDADDRLTTVDQFFDYGGNSDYPTEPSSPNYYHATSTFDAAGNTLTAEVTTTDGAGTTTTTHTTNTWDDQGRLVAVDQSGASGVHHGDYAYDDAGNRVAMRVDGATTSYLNDPTLAYDQVLEEYTGGLLAATYVRGLDLLFEDRSGVRSYYAVDGLGSTRALTDASGVVTDTYTYDAYGTTIGQAGTTENSYQYAGQGLDAATGLYHMGARYYEASAGRFTSRDSYDGSMSDPISENHYAYADANPISNFDPSGHESTETITVGTISTGFAAFLLGSVYVGLNLAAHLADSAAAAAPQLAPVAAALGVKVITDIQDLDRSPNYVYFVHGASAESWGNSTRIDTSRGSGEFGQGFYTFLATPEGITGAEDRARASGGGPFVLVVRVEKSNYEGMKKLQFNGDDWQWQLTVQSYRSGGIYPPAELADVVIGPVATTSARQGFYRPIKHLPDQYAFKLYAAPKLEAVAVVPVSD